MVYTLSESNADIFQRGNTEAKRIPPEKKNKRKSLFTKVSWGEKKKENIQRKI